jgi:hypothetical protein
LKKTTAERAALQLPSIVWIRWLARRHGRRKLATVTRGRSYEAKIKLTLIRSVLLSEWAATYRNRLTATELIEITGRLAPIFAARGLEVKEVSQTDYRVYPGLNGDGYEAYFVEVRLA